MNGNREWHTMGGGNNRQGLFSSTARANSAKGVSRRMKSSGSVSASPLCDGVMIYVADMTGLAHAFDYTGDEIGRIQLSGSIQSSPALSLQDSYCFLATLQGEIYAVDTTSGDIVWQRRISARRDPRIISDILYLPNRRLVVTCSWGEKFVALNAKTGEVKHTWNAGYCPYAAASADVAENIYFLRSETDYDDKTPNGVRLVKKSLDNDEETSLYFAPEGAEKKVHECIQWAAPVIDETAKRVIFIINRNQEGTLYVLSVESGKMEFSHTFNRHIFATPAVSSNGTIFVSDLKGDVHAFNTDGEKRWQYQTGAEYLLSSPVCDVEETVWACDIEGKVHRIAPNGEGNVVFEAERSIQSRPAFTPEGRLLVPSMDGNVYGIG